MDPIVANAAVDHGLGAKRVAAPEILDGTVRIESKELFKKRKTSFPDASTRTLVVAFKGNDRTLANIPSFTLFKVATRTLNFVVPGINQIATIDELIVISNTYLAFLHLLP